jgi:hypothetical protein
LWPFRLWHPNFAPVWLIGAKGFIWEISETQRFFGTPGNRMVQR